MNDSILTSIKKLLGIGEDDTSFDTDILLHINSTFSVLTQLGIGPKEGYSIGSKSETWSDYIDDNKKQQMVVSYMYLKVRLLFDPPQSSVLVQAIKDQISEQEFRLTVSV
jgi:hypothetical protein